MIFKGTGRFENVKNIEKIIRIFFLSSVHIIYQIQLYDKPSTMSEIIFKGKTSTMKKCKVLEQGPRPLKRNYVT